MYRFFLLLGLFTLSVHAGEPITVKNSDRQVAVVELYTSQGCHSCPPADRWLSQLESGLGDQFEVLPLGFHVDYWNYLGWKDQFSRKEFTSRQRQLGANNQQRTIYTPEFFVNGLETRGASKILSEIENINQRKAPTQLALTVSLDKGSLVCNLATTENQQADELMHHRYIVYENDLVADILRGENAGKILEYQHVVRYMSDAIGLQANNRHEILLDPDWNLENVGVAVLVTTPGNTQYLQAIHTPISDLVIQN